MREKRRKFRVMLIIGALLFTGCQVKTDVHFDLDEQWQVTSQFEYSKRELQNTTKAIVGFAADIAEVPSSIGGLSALFVDNPHLIKLGFQELANYYAPLGITLNYDDRSFGDNRRYDVELSGSGYDLLKSEILTFAQISTTPEGYVSLRLQVSEMDILLAGAIDQEISVSGKRIISSNADSQGFGKATWRQPITSVQVVVEPGRPFPILPVAIGGALAVGGLGVGVAASLAWTRMHSRSRSDDLFPNQSNYSTSSRKRKNRKSRNSDDLFSDW